MRRASSLSLLFGTLALTIGFLALMGLSDWLGFGSQPDSTWEVIGGIPVVLALVFGLLGLVSGVERSRAIAGMVLAALCVMGWNQLKRNGVRRSEAGAIGDVRAVISAQAAYASANAGAYDRLECMSHPATCLPGYPESAPTFLDSKLASGQLHGGYARTFFLGPPAKGLSASSMTSFAYIAVPATPGTAGYRAVCGDASGMICATRDGSMPLVQDGRCVTHDRWFQRASDCTPLR